MSRLQLCSSPHAEKNAVTRTRISATATRNFLHLYYRCLSLRRRQTHAHIT